MTRRQTLEKRKSVQISRMLAQQTDGPQSRDQSNGTEGDLQIFTFHRTRRKLIYGGQSSVEKEHEKVGTS